MNNGMLFVFDLDSTVTRCELLPLIAERTGFGEEIARRTERAMASAYPFESDFRERVRLLGDVPVSIAREIVRNAPVNPWIARFLRENRERCLILTGNLDVWIEGLIERLGMTGRVRCSEAILEDDRVSGIAAVLDKETAAKALREPFLAVGDGSNDTGMFRVAEVAVAFAGVRTPPEALLRVADHVAEDERALLRILENYL